MQTAGAQNAKYPKTMNSDLKTMADFVSCDDPELFAKTLPFSEFITDWRQKGTYTYQLRIVSACENRVTVEDQESGTRRELILLASNNYLGLNRHPEVIRAAGDALERFGSGMCGSRYLSGTYDLVQDLEADIAEFEHTEAAAVFTTGYQANLGTLSALLRADDVVYADRLDHASIIDGCRLSGARMRIFRHNDPEHLDHVMSKTPCEGGQLVVVDGVFSMDGDLAPLPDLMAVCRKHGARFMVDEAHGTGVVGKTGRGSVEYFGVEDEVDIILGTFSKSLGATGGFVAANWPVVEYVKHYGRSYMFSASPVPSVIAGVRKAFEIIQTDSTRHDRLWKNIRRLHRHLKDGGLTVFPDPPESAVLTLPVGLDQQMRAVSSRLFEQGLFTSNVAYPAVTRNESRLRLSVSALHTNDDIDEAAAIIARVWDEFSLR